MLRLYEFFQDNSYYYLVTEYCKGGDLFRKLDEAIYLQEGLVARIMKQIFSAVEYCHRLKIAHR